MLLVHNHKLVTEPGLKPSFLNSWVQKISTQVPIRDTTQERFQILKG